MKTFLILYLPSATLMAWLGFVVFPTVPWWGALLWGMVMGVVLAFFGGAIIGFALQAIRIVFGVMRD